MVFQATVYLRSEHLAGFASVDMRLTGHLFLWVINVKSVLVRETSFEIGSVGGFLHFQCPHWAWIAEFTVSLGLRPKTENPDEAGATRLRRNGAGLTRTRG